MTFTRRDTASRMAMAAALVLLTACADLFPWHEPAVRAYVSVAVPQCSATDSLCAVLTQLPQDAQLLAHLEQDSLAGKAQLVRTTGMAWTEQRVEDGPMHVSFPTPPEGQPQSVYVLEAVRAEVAHDSLLSVASNGGTVVWLNGQLLGASRVAARGARAHQDLYTAPLRQGTNLILYRVLTNGADAQLHREWHPSVARPDLLAASIDLGAWATLARTPLLPDSATAVELWPPQVWLADGPVVHFTWRTLLGERLADGGQYTGPHPASLPLPTGFHGMAVLRTEVQDAAGLRLYVEDSPIFTDSTARRLARTLAADSTADDPVRAARVGAVRAAFNLGSTAGNVDPGDWIRAQVLASLYQFTSQPTDFHRHIGPQVWGYRAADGSVQPYWLAVPPAAVRPGAPSSEPPGLVFSVTHMVAPDFWAGRGRISGFVVRLATMSSSYGTFGVLPHLGGLQDFDTLAVRELPAITRQVAASFAIDTAAVGLLAWSSHAVEAVQVALDPRVPMGWLGLAVPAFYRDEADRARVLDSLSRVRPRLHWLVWQASEDTIIRQARTEQWASEVDEKGFDVRYRLVPYSTHLGGYFEDIEADLFRSVAIRSRGTASGP